MCLAPAQAQRRDDMNITADEKKTTKGPKYTKVSRN